MSEARVQEEWMPEEGIHERPHLCAVPDAEKASTIDQEQQAAQNEVQAELEQHAVAEPDLKVNAADFVGVMDQFDALMIKARQYPLLTAGQEKEIARKVQRGLMFGELLTNNYHELSLDKVEEYKKEVETGRHYNNEFCNHNLRWVASIALDYFHGHPQGKRYGLLDLFQEGYLGLEHAVDKFDPDYGTKFSTYATDWIRQSIDRALKDKGTLIRASTHYYEGLHAYEKLDAQGLSEEEIKAELEVDDTKLQLFRDVRFNRDTRVVSIDKKIKSENGYGETQLHEVTPDPRAEEEFEEFVDQGMAEKAENRALNKIIKLLEPFMTEVDLKLLRKLSSGEKLSDSQDRSYRKVLSLTQHPAVWSQIIKFVEKTEEVKPRGDWREQAACTDLGEYYAKPKESNRKDAKEVCGSCAVRAECELFLITNKPEKGMWIDGRTHYSEKLRLQAQRAATTKKAKGPKNKKTVKAS
jgi:RNA polymerase sigma factor (sigma-70 family)